MGYIRKGEMMEMEAETMEYDISKILKVGYKLKKIVKIKVWISLRHLFMDFAVADQCD